MASLIRKLLQSVRFFLARRGFDIRRIEQFCFPDQQALLQDTAVRCVFDIGANIGDISARYLAMFPTARIYCFEPRLAALEVLRQRFQAQPELIVESAGIGAEAGSARFFVNADADTSSLLSADTAQLGSGYQRGMQSAQEMQIEIVALDGYCTAHAIDQIDVLKLDIQGGELAALRGAEALLRAGRIRLIYSEVFFLPFYQAQPLFGDIAAYLAQFGYTLHALYNTSYSGSTGRLQWADAVFVSPALQAKSATLRRSTLA
jgi:FkbM family methyltransferase